MLVPDPNSSIPAAPTLTSRKLAAPPRVIVGILVAAAIYVVAEVLMFSGYDDWLGSKSFADIATHLLNGAGYTADGVHPTAGRPPVYPLILAGTMAIAGKNWFACTIVLQALAMAACMLLVFEITARLWPHSAAPRLAVGLLALHGPFMIEMLALRETVWATLGLLGVAWLLLRNSTTWGSAVAMGASLAAVYLLRPSGALIAVVTLPFLVWSRWTIPGRRSLGITLLTGAVLALPWQIYTWKTFGPPGFFPSDSPGYNLCKGAMLSQASFYPWIDADVIDRRMWPLVEGIPMEDMRAIDRRYKAIAWELMRKNPVATARHGLVNALAFSSPLPIPLGRGRLIEKDGDDAVENFRLDWISLLFVPAVILVLVPGLLGTLALAKGNGLPRRWGLWLAGLCLAFLAAHALTFVKTRYRLPLDALLVIPASAWLARYTSRWWRLPPHVTRS